MLKMTEKKVVKKDTNSKEKKYNSKKNNYYRMRYTWFIANSIIGCIF